MRLAAWFVIGLLIPTGSVFAKDKTLMIGAASSLQEVLQPIVNEFSKKHKKVKVNATFAGTNIIARQVEAGAPIDVVLSADKNNVEQLRKAGHLNLNVIRDFARNQLLVVTSSDLKIEVKQPKDLLRPEIKTIAVADAQVPVGFYSRQYLERQKLLKDLEKKFVKVDNVRGAVTLVQKKAAQVAFIYFTDWKAVGADLNIAWKIPENEVDPIVYPAAVTKQCRDRALCAAFVNFLSTPESQAILEKAGFLRIR